MQGSGGLAGRGSLVRRCVSGRPRVGGRWGSDSAVGPDWQQRGVERRGHEREALEVELAGVRRCWVVENK